jgi:hypothetical protein
LTLSFASNLTTSKMKKWRRHDNFSSIGVRERLLMAQTPIVDAERLLPVTNDYSLKPMPISQSLPYQAYLYVSRGPFSRGWVEMPRDCRALTRQCGELRRQWRGTDAAVAVQLPRQRGEVPRRL